MRAGTLILVFSRKRKFLNLTFLSLVSHIYGNVTDVREIEALINRTPRLFRIEHVIQDMGSISSVWTSQVRFQTQVSYTTSIREKATIAVHGYAQNLVGMGL